MFPFFNHYPGTDLHEIDLAYILKLCAELRASNATLTIWKTTHESEYAELENKVDGLINNLVDVISPWDSSIAYHIFSIVEYQGINYIAVQDVPVGVMITNTDYWQPANTALDQINAIGLIVSNMQKSGKNIFNVVEEGVIPDDETQAAYNTSILQELINDSTDPEFGRMLVFPAGKRIYFNEISIEDSLPTIFTGGGVLTGKITSTNDTRHKSITFTNITFEYDELEETNNPLELKMIDGLVIDGCIFVNCNACLTGQHNVFQNLQQVIFTNCRTYNCNYNIYTEYTYPGSGALVYSMGDLIFTNNELHNNIEGLHIEALDGGVIANNTFFFPSYPEQDQTKTNNIYLNNSTFVRIVGNTLFEAGYHGIYCDKLQTSVISDNVIAWNGQRSSDNGAAILVVGGLTDNFGINVISNNVIMRSAGNGIVTSGLYFNISDNMIFECNSRAYYYGDTSESNSQSIYNTALYTIITNNVCNNGITATNGTVTGNFINAVYEPGTIYKHGSATTNEYGDFTFAAAHIMNITSPIRCIATKESGNNWRVHQFGNTSTTAAEGLTRLLSTAIEFDYI